MKMRIADCGLRNEKPSALLGTSLFRTPHSAPRNRSSGQATVEIAFVMLIFFFVGMMGFETGVMYHNVNVVSNALKQGAWLASRGAQDELIMSTIQNCDTYMMKSAWFDHRTEDFSIEVYIHDTTGAEFQISPSQWDQYLTPASTTRSAYVWRSQGKNIRIGLRYVAGYVSPFMSADPMFRISLPLVASMPILIRNDEDNDGMADLYEMELFVALRTGTATDSGWRAQSHTDTYLQPSDSLGTDIDGDSVLDANEQGRSRYDFDNDGIMDAYDRWTRNNRLRHPRIGGYPMTNQLP